MDCSVCTIDKQQVTERSFFSEAACKRDIFRPDIPVHDPKLHTMSAKLAKRCFNSPPERLARAYPFPQYNGLSTYPSSTLLFSRSTAEKPTVPIILLSLSSEIAQSATLPFRYSRRTYSMYPFVSSIFRCGVHSRYRVTSSSDA